jgi:transcription elongation GreA/GreB family factor
MMNIRQRSVNVKRSELLTALRANLETHKEEYKQALIDFKLRLLEDLQAGVEKVNASEPKDLAKFNVQVMFPQNHEKDFMEVIEMLDMSVDDNINLDAESFRAYFKNEWSWTVGFRSLTESYKAAGSFLSN